LTEASIATVQALRSPSPDPNAITRPETPLAPWIKSALWPLVFLALTGLVVSLSVHIAALMGILILPSGYFSLLHIGIFVVFFPAVAVSQKLVGNTRRSDFWKAILRWAPDWMRNMVYVFMVYAMVNFAIFMVNVESHSRLSGPVEWRGASGHWMAFYSAAFAILYSAVHSPSDAHRQV
jgi:hypothetical protein